ncbi:MAG TPA: hypothetical protein VK469_10630 [Candidatus Kapabacteria bacterium]|nr:hypothetical protein [Candidatus Kapabacteria bacterium]
MLKILLDNKLKTSKSMVNDINSYIYHVYKLKFNKASQSIKLCSNKVDDERKSAKDTNDGCKLNQLFVVSVYLEMLKQYSIYWEQILEDKYSESWCTLQNVLDSLRVVKRFNENHTKFYLKFIEEQMTGFEKLYPYKLFLSSEIIIKDVECSICGKDFNSLECEHLVGELYDGRMAYGIAKGIENIPAVSLVDNPKDKRCVMLLENNAENFHRLYFLSKAIKKHKISPWDIGGVRESIRKRNINEFDIKGDEKCLCGSGKTFEECCKQVGFVEFPHMDILINKREKIPPVPFYF